MYRTVLFVMIAIVCGAAAYSASLLLSLQAILPEISASIAEARCKGTLDSVGFADPKVLSVDTIKIEIDEVWTENEYIRERFLYVFPWRRKTGNQYLCITFASAGEVSQLLNEFDSSIEFRASGLRQMAFVMTRNGKDVFWFALDPADSPWRMVSFIDRKKESTIASCRIRPTEQ